MSARSNILALGLLVLTVFVTLVSADEERINPIGRPEKFKQGEATGYAVWYEDGSWNLRMTSRERKSKKGKKTERGEFTGTVTLDKGRISEGTFQGLESAKSLKDADWIRVHKGRKGFDFHFLTIGKTDGVSFKVSDETQTLNFKLLVAGDDEPTKIMIGAKGESPKKDPFDLPAHPKE
jgi:hypothetical protein